MQPDLPQPQFQAPTSLPAVPLPPNPLTLAQPAAASSPLQQFTPQPAAPLAEHVAAQTEELLQRYGQNPYELAEAFGQFKSGYLAHHHHIAPNAAGK